MSDTAKFSSKDIKDWLESETSSIFVPVHAKAQKTRDDMKKALENITDANKMLLDNSAKEIDKKNMKTFGRARALNKLGRLFLDRMRQIKAPNEVSYDSLNAFYQETQKAFQVTEVDIRNFFQRISPFFIMDRRKFQMTFEKAKLSLKDMNNFLTKEYVKTKTLEETFQLIDKLQTSEEQLANLKEKRKKVELEKTAVEKEIAETQQKMTTFKSTGSMGQLDQLNVQTDALSAEVKHNLQHLQKPFVKLQALGLHGGGSGLTQDESKKLIKYIENPFEALATEEANYPLLRQILEKLRRSMSDGKISLKSDKKRKAEQAMDNILNKNSLASLQQKCVNLASQRSQLSTSVEVEETKRTLTKLHQHIENLETKKGVVESEEITINKAVNETLERIKNQKTTIEKNVFDFMDKRIRIE
ncbi:MAG TPA: hypothetical protein VIH48_04200 [Candidatus Bathyarchaeia archaeon]